MCSFLDLDLDLAKLRYNTTAQHTTENEQRRQKELNVLIPNTYSFAWAHFVFIEQFGSKVVEWSWIELKQILYQSLFKCEPCTDRPCYFCRHNTNP